MSNIIALGAGLNQRNFYEIYNSNKELVWNLVSKYISLYQDKEDLFQEVFIRIHKALKSFRGESDIKTWIYRIAINTSINFIKKKKRQEKIKEMFKFFKLKDLSSEAIKAKEEENIELFKPLEKLNPKQKMIIILSDVEERAHP